MYGIKVRIRSLTADYGYDKFVECMLTDYDGHTHYFRDKLPVFTPDITANLPCDGVIRCMLKEEHPKYAVVDTMLPDDVESTMGEHRFRVSYDDLVDNA
jgi:hypothetical protein